MLFVSISFYIVLIVLDNNVTTYAGQPQGVVPTYNDRVLGAGSYIIVGDGPCAVPKDAGQPQGVVPTYNDRVLGAGSYIIVGDGPCAVP